MAEVQKITCPNCKTEISVDDVLHAQIEMRIREQYEENKRKDKEAIEAKEAELIKKTKELEADKKNADRTIANAISSKMAELVKKEEEVEKVKRDTDIFIANSVKEKLALREKEIQQQAKQNSI